MDAGSLRALIADQSSGIVPGATVTLTNEATGVAKSLVSDGEGYAAFTPIQRGSYSLRVELNNNDPQSDPRQLLEMLQAMANRNPKNEKVLTTLWPRFCSMSLDVTEGGLCGTRTHFG